MSTAHRQEKKSSNYHTIFSNNSFAGELYLVKFYNDETLYSGIPIAQTRSRTGRAATFSFNVLEPEDASGVYRRPFHEIEYAVRKV
ncbi:hypothetical protein [Salinispira pacifica]